MNLQEKSTADAYDAIAEGYTTENDSSLLNEYYNRPAILSLLGDVAGHHVLDAGCGSGPVFADLLELGATVVGTDGSQAMLDVARGRLGPDADLRVADLANPLPFQDGTFDDVVCSLALHYVKNWQTPLAEMKRVLRPGGRLVLSLEHPFATWLGNQDQGEKPNYFETRKRTETWTLDDQEAQLDFWDRSLSSMVGSFLDSGFRILHIGEPAPSSEALERFPEFFKDRKDPRFLAFLFIILEA